MKIRDLTLEYGIMLAPMAGITDAAFRLMARRTGCDMAVTEMISAEGLVRNGPRTRQFIELHPDERPAGVQLFGANADVLARAAEMVERSGADLLDINMGCPAKKVTRNGSGSALMKDPRNAARIMQKVRKATTLPLTVKIRAGWNGAANFIEIGKVAENEGVDAVVLHPRTVEQAFTGKANWGLIGELKSSISIPVVGNGDIRSAGDAGKMLRETGCDGVMAGRGALGNPWLFRSIRSMLMDGGRDLSPSIEEKKGISLEHLRTAVLLFGEQAGIRAVKPHLAWYTRRMRGASMFRSSVSAARNAPDIERLIESFFAASEKTAI